MMIARYRHVWRRQAAPPLALLALFAGCAALALGPWSVRLADSGPVSSGFWRLALALPVTAFLAFRIEGVPAPLPRAQHLLVICAGAAFALDLASWHIGIERTRLGNAVLFGNAGSVVLIAWGFVVARRWPRGIEWTILGAAGGGIALLLAQSARVSLGTLAGDGLCLIAGLSFAVYLLALEPLRANLGPWQLLLRVGLVGSPILLAMALVLGEPVVPGPSWSDWLPLLVLAGLSQIVGQGLLIYSLGKVAPLIIGLALLTEPIIAAIVGYVVFDEGLGAADIAGMALVAAALTLARWRSRQGPATS